MADRITIRAAQVDDLTGIMELFRNTVQTVCAADYTPDQRRVWIDRGMNRERWQVRLTKQFFLVAEVNHQLTGFGSLDGNTYIDLMYVHKDAQGKGIATALLTALEQEALRHGVKAVTSDVSKTARPFFERMGYRVLEERTQVLDGVALSNYRMEHLLA